jgi:hypothetical protein
VRSRQTGRMEQNAAGARKSHAEKPGCVGRVISIAQNGDNAKEPIRGCSG